ncbi:MAG: nuclear transport factor 2 family protein [Acidobacteria bacterium]|nr:nuclear transport factor 2 family protein [Acidobacteriota bacterium]
MRKPLIAVCVAMAMLAIGRAQQPTGPPALTLTPLDYFEIQQLHVRFSHGLDGAADAGAMFASVFTPDGSYVDETGATHTGREALASFAAQDRDGVKGPTNIRHFTTSLLLEPHPGGLTGRSRVLIVTGPAGGRRTVTQGGQYYDDLVMTADGWRFARRAFVGAGRPEPPAPPPATPVARRTTPAFTAEEYAAITQMYARYAFTWDGVLDDGREWIRLFTPDGSHTNETSAPKQFFFGHEELLGFARAMRVRGSRVPETVGHWITNVLIDRIPEGAAVKAYRFNVSIAGLGQPGGLGSSGIYFDYLVKTPEGWQYRRKNFMGANSALPETATTPSPASRPAAPAASRVQPWTHTLAAQDDMDIRQLYARATHAFDSAAEQGQAFARAFTADGVFVDIDGRSHQGAASLAALAQRVNGGKGPGNATEFIYNQLIEPAPGGAAGKSYVVVARLAAPGQPATAITAGQYHDTLVQTPQGWRISRRTFVKTPGGPATASR